MATLWERIIGDNLPPVPTPSEEKIALHGFWGMVHEWQRGYENAGDVVDFFSLDAGQLVDAQVIKDNINAVPTLEGQSTFIRVCKDWSYVGEISTTESETLKYHDWAAFVTRMNNEVTDQGGTAP